MKLLIVEDNRTDADLIQWELSSLETPHEVWTAESLQDAMKRLQQEPPIDMVLLDLHLPDGNGLELLSHVRQRRMPVVVVVFTGSGDEETVVSTLQAGANDYVIKNPGFVAELPPLLEYYAQNREASLYESAVCLRVAYLEHEPMDVDLTLRHFRKYAPNLEIEVFSYGADFLRKLGDPDEPQVDVLLTDYNLPRMNALQLIKEIRQVRKSDIPVVLVTGQGKEEVAIQALKLGADEYIVKRENYLFRLPSLVLGAYRQRLITRQKQELEESRRRYQMLADNSGDVIFTLDWDLNYTYVSPSIRNLRGYEPEELLLTKISDYLTERSVEIMQESLASFVPVEGNEEVTQDPRIVELEIRCKDGSLIWVEVKASVMLDPGGKPRGILGVSRDITRRKQYEFDLIAARDRAEESDRLKTAFLQNISHEIRTPMNGILGFANLLNDALLSEQERGNYLKIIEKSGRRMLHTIHDIVEMSRLQTGQISFHHSPVDLHHLMQELHQFFLAKAREKGLRLEYATSGRDSLVLFTDEVKLNIIATNLIQNAIKYTRTGKIDFGFSVRGKEVEVFVADTGIGIPEENRGVVFDRFTRLDNAMDSEFEGTGLGLSIAKSYVGLLGGRIWIESNEPRGTVFRFTLPLGQEDFGTESEDREESPPDLAGIRILVAEDDDINVMYLLELLNRTGAVVVRARTGLEAVDLMKDGPPVHLVFMNIRMPGKDGVEAARDIRNLNRDIPIVALTGFTREEVLGWDTEGVFRAYLRKPVTDREMFLALREILT
ncbi:MAG: response regulator [Bacteroidales bacterium]